MLSKVILYLGVDETGYGWFYNSIFSLSVCLSISKKNLLATRSNIFSLTEPKHLIRQSNSFNSYREKYLLYNCFSVRYTSKFLMYLCIMILGIKSLLPPMYKKFTNY